VDVLRAANKGPEATSIAGSLMIEIETTSRFLLSLPAPH
jgi:hypothetical protein